MADPTKFGSVFATSGKYLLSFLGATIKLLLAGVLPYVMFAVIVWLSINYFGKFLGDSLLFNLFFKD